jgi:hypothetical protein
MVRGWLRVGRSKTLACLNSIHRRTHQSRGRDYGIILGNVVFQGFGKQGARTGSAIQSTTFGASRFSARLGRERQTNFRATTGAPTPTTWKAAPVLALQAICPLPRQKSRQGRLDISVKNPVARRAARSRLVAHSIHRHEHP